MARTLTGKRLNIALLLLIFLLTSLGVVSCDDDARGNPSATFLPDESESDSEVYAGAQGAEFEILVHLDDSISEKFETILDECLYPDANDSETVSTLINETDEYLFLRKRWLEFFKSSRQNNSDVFHLSRPEIEKRKLQVRQVKYLQQSLKVVKKHRETDEILSHLSPLSLKWKTAFDFEQGANISNATLQYLEQYKHALVDLEDSVRVLEQLKIESKLNFTCLNESLPDNYTQIGHETLTSKSEITPFYNTAVVFGKIIEPILLCIIISLGLALNLTLIWIFLRHKEIGNSENAMILNLAIAGVLRVASELPLFYQQAYFSRYFTIEPPIFSAVHTFFIAVNAFSILALNLLHYRTMTSHPYETSTLPGSIIRVALVWLAALGVAVIAACFNKTHQEADDVITSQVIMFVAFGIVSPVAMSVLNFLIAQRYAGITLDVKDKGYQQLEQSCKRGTKVAISLSVGYFIGFIPDAIRSVVSSFFDQRGYEHSVVLQFVDRAFACLFYFNVCVFPMALFVASGKFRKLFKLYLFRCLATKAQTDDKLSTNVTSL